MQEISKILQDKQRDTPFQLMNWLRKHHVDIILEDGFNRPFLNTKLFTLVSKCPQYYTKEEWDLMTMIAYIFIISTYHPNDIIPKIPLKEESSGPLFATILLLNSLKPYNQDTREQRLEIFRIAVNYFNTGFDTKNFYSRSPIYFYLTIPPLLANEIPTQDFSPQLQFFLNSIPHMKETDLNYDFVVFTSEIFLQMMKCNGIPNGTFQAFKRILELCRSSSYIFLQHFFRPWFYFMNKYRKEHQIEVDAYSDQIDTVTRLFSKTASLKYHELHRSFNWHLCFHFFTFVKKEEYQERILALIGNGIRRANRFELFPGVDTLCYNFSELWFKDYKFGHSWALYYFLSSLDSTMLGLVSNFDRIIGAASVNSTQNEEISNRKVTFSEENNFSNQLDKELYFVIKVRKFDKLDDVVPVFADMTKYCNSIRKHLSSVVHFQLKFGHAICNFLNRHIQKNSNEDLSIPFHYLLGIIRAWTQLMIAVSHKQNVMNTYSQREIELYPHFPPDLKSRINNTQRILVFTIFEPFFQLLAESPKEYYPTYATAISDQMFRTLKSKQLTYSFIEFFNNLHVDMPQYSESLFSHLLGKMFEIAIEHIDLLFSPNSSDAELLYLWVLFTIRFGSFTTKDKPNLILGIYLNTYQRLFIYNVLNNLKRIMNQSIALKMVKIYIEMEKYHYQDLQKEQDECEKRKKLSGRAPFRFDDIQESALHESYDTIFTLYNDDHNSISFQFLIPFLDGALKTNDEELLSKAATAYISTFKAEQSKDLVSNSDSNNSFCSVFFSLINQLNEETGKEILNLLPKYASLYLQTTQETFTPNKSIIIEEYGFELDSILEALINNLNGNEEIYTTLFLLLNCCFSIVLKNLDVISTKYTKTMKLSLILLCHCWSQSHLQSQVEQYSFWLAHQFGDAFISDSSNVFILCLLDIAGSSRSYITAIALNIAKTFFEYINHKQVSLHSIHVTVASLFTSFPPNSRLFSIMCGLSLFSRYFPNFIFIDHIHCVIIQSVDIYPLDTKFPRVVNSLIKEFLKDRSIDMKKKFIDTIYKAVSPLSIGIRIVLMKRIEKLNIPLPIKSINEIEAIEDLDTFAQTSTLAFLSGIEGELEITPSFYQKLKKYIIVKPEGHLYDKLARKLALLLSIFKNDYALNYFSEKNDLASFLPYLCHGLSTPISALLKLTKKCFSILAVKTITDSTFIKQINGFCEKPLSFFKFFQTPADRINFYVRLVRIMPTKIPSENVKLFLDAMLDYDKQSDSQKMLHFLHFIRIIKFFTVSEYIKTSAVESIILTEPSENEPYLHLYIQTICNLYQNTKISLKPMAQKYVIRFLLLFAKETVDYLMNNQRTFFAFYFLRDLIIGDASLTFFNLFIETIKNYRNYQFVHPSIFKIAEFLSCEDKLASKLIFLDALKINFENLYSIVSDSSSRNENDFTLITYCATSWLHVMEYQLCVSDVVSFVRIFRLSFFSRSNIAKLFLYVVFQKSDMSFRIELLNFLKTNATTLEPLYLQKLLPHVIRYTNDVDLSDLWDLLPQWTIQCADAKYAFVHSILRLLEKCEPTNEALNTIFEVIKTTLTSANIRLIIYSLKVVICLSKMRKLKPVVFMSIFRQLLTYPKFTEPPYSAYFVSLLKSDPDIFSSFSSRDIEILLNYVRCKLLHLSELKKLFSETMSIFVAAPKLMSFLPFSLLTAASTLIAEKLKNPSDSNIKDIADAINHVAHFCLEMKPSQEEIDCFLGVGFSFLSFVQKKKISLQFNQIIYFYEILIQNDKNYFPDHILNEIETIDRFSFDLICCAANNIPHVLLNDFSGLVDKALVYVENKDNKIDSDYLSCLMKSLMQLKKFDNVIKRTFEIVKKMYTCKNSEKLFTISKVMISQGASWCLDNLWQFYDSLQGKSIGRHPLLRFLIMRIEDVPGSEQITTVQTILARIHNSVKKTHIFTTSLPSLFQSQRVKISVKNYIVENLIPLLLIDNLCNAEKMLAMLYEYNNQTPCTRYIIQLLLIRAHRSHDSGSLIFIERIIQMLPIDYKQRLQYLMINLPIEMWEDSFLPVIISLLTPKIQIWQPLFTLAHKFSSIGCELITATFSKLIDSSNVDSIKLFLNKLLHVNSKVHYSQIISGLLQTFHQMEIRIESHLAQEAIKYSGNSYQLEFFLNPEKENEKVISHFLLPHESNDMIFGIYLPYLSINQAAAIALTFLNEYDAALITYLECNDDSILFNEMRKINNKFIITDDNNINSILKPLVTIGHNNSPLDIIKELATKSQEVNVQLNIQKAIDANYESTIGKYCLSLYEKQQLCIIQSLLCVLNNDPQLNIDSSKINPVFLDVYNNFNRFINGMSEVPKGEIDGQTDPIIFLMPSMKNSFEKVCGYSHQGLVALNYNQIQSYFDLISKKVSNEAMENDDWYSFANFLFSLFCLQPSDQLIKTAFGAYSRVIMNTNLNFSFTVLNEAACRIITMIRISLKMKTQSFFDVIQSFSSLFSVSHINIWTLWIPQLIELAEEDWFYQIVDDVFNNRQYLTYILSQNSKSKQIQDFIMKILNDNPKQFQVLKQFETFFNCLFSIPCDEKPAQTKMVAFLIQLMKLNSVDGLDLMVERTKKNSVSNFHITLSKLTKKQIDLLGDLNQLMQHLKGKTSLEIADYVKEITNSANSLTFYRLEASEKARELNKMLPFSFDLKVEKNMQLMINYIQDNFLILNQNTIAIKMVTNVYKWSYFIIQRSLNENGYRKSTRTLANIIIFIKQMLQKDYSSKIRKLLISSTHIFEVGHNMMIVPIVSEPTTLENMFQESELMTTADFIEQYTVQTEDKERQLTQEGIERVQQFDTHYVLKKYSLEIPCQSFIQMKSIAVNSLSILGFIKTMFNAPYPDLTSCIFCPIAPLTPLIYHQFDHGCMTDPQISPSCFRLSPSIRNFFGAELKGRCILTTAVVSKALLNNLESIRSFLEILIGDECDQNGGPFNFQHFTDTRNRIENRFMNFCPPTGKGIGKDVAANWFNQVQIYVDKAMNPDIEPIETIPWF